MNRQFIHQTASVENQLLRMHTKLDVK